MIAYGVAGDPRPTVVPCLKGCRHNTYDVTKTILVNYGEKYDSLVSEMAEQQSLEQLKANVAQARSHGLCVLSKGSLYPTILGMWFEETNFN